MVSISFDRARLDIVRSFQLYGLWGYLGISDVVARYRNTLLGPIWNSAYLIGQALALSFVFGAVFGQRRRACPVCFPIFFRA